MQAHDSQPSCSRASCAWILLLPGPSAGPDRAPRVCVHTEAALTGIGTTSKTAHFKESYTTHKGPMQLKTVPHLCSAGCQHCGVSCTVSEGQGHGVAGQGQRLPLRESHPLLARLAASLAVGGGGGAAAEQGCKTSLGRHVISCDDIDGP